MPGAAARCRHPGGGALWAKSPPQPAAEAGEPAGLALTGDPARAARLTVPPAGPAAAPGAGRVRVRHRRSTAPPVPGRALHDGLERAPVLLAARIDDTRLDRAGPRLVLPQDRCGARYVRGVTARGWTAAAAPGP